jgi:hypothetical protein
MVTTQNLACILARHMAMTRTRLRPAGARATAMAQARPELGTDAIIDARSTPGSGTTRISSGWRAHKMEEA